MAPETILYTRTMVLDEPRGGVRAEVLDQPEEVLESSNSWLKRVLELSNS